MTYFLLRWVVNVFINAITNSTILKTAEPFIKTNPYILKFCSRTQILAVYLTLNSMAEQDVCKLGQRSGGSIARLAFRRYASYLHELQSSIRDISIHIALLPLTFWCSQTTCPMTTLWPPSLHPLYNHPHYGSCLHSFWQRMNSSNLEIVSQGLSTHRILFSKSFSQHWMIDFSSYNHIFV